MWIFGFVRLFLTYKNVESFIFVILHNSTVPLPRESRLEVQTVVAKRAARNWGLNNIPRTIKNSKEEFFKCSDIAAVYSTPVSFTRHRSGSRVSRIHETLVIGTATRKKLSSSVMRTTLLKPNLKLNRWPDWNEICKDLLAFVKDCCIQDSGRKYVLCLESCQT